jgi:UPF0755 protein
MSRERGRRREGGGVLSGLWASISLVLTLGLALIAGGLLLLTELNRNGPSQAETVFVAGEGAGAIQIANALEEQGLIRHPLAFRAAAELYARGRHLQAGEYAIPAGASPRDIVQILASGRSIQYTLTIPEGWTTAMAMERIAAAPELEGPMPPTPPEGALLADTYSFPRGTTREALVAQMTTAMDEFVAEAWAARAADLPFDTPEEAVTLASIVEKETGLGEERPRVAGVFVNRLQRGMRLESDPTIIYGICQCNRLRDAAGNPRGIRRSEIERRTDYNTYQIDGLPPGPIANPGRDAILAVLNPPQTEDLFFVALDPFDPSKGHVFSTNYADHNRAVARLRAAEAASSP